MQPHHCSFAIWDVPTTVVAGERFTIKIGAKSSAEHDLKGQRLEVCDSAGTVAASAELGSSQWPGTRALYWTELTLPAPPQHGLASLMVRFAAAGLNPAHGAASAKFAVMVVQPPEHSVVIQVVTEGTAAPVAEADIRLGPYRATTDASGRVELRVCAGRHGLCVWKIGYEAPPRVVTVGGGVFVEVTAAIVPEENADRAWSA